MDISKARAAAQDTIENLDGFWNCTARIYSAQSGGYIIYDEKAHVVYQTRGYNIEAGGGNEREVRPTLSLPLSLAHEVELKANQAVYITTDNEDAKMLEGTYYLINPIMSDTSFMVVWSMGKDVNGE